MGMSGSRINPCWVPHAFLFLIVVLGLPSRIQCVDGDDYSRTGNLAALPVVTQLIYGRLSNLTTVFRKDIEEKFGFCIKDANLDWNGAFDFTGKLDFLTNCIKKTKGDLTQRLCTAAEIKFYFRNIFERQAADDNYLKPNRNCNLTSWVSGCEPGWGCSVGQDQKIDLRNLKSMPASRTHDCQPCCEGFFCPQACPLGSYCPRAKLNKTTGICDPYSYQIPPGKRNHTCGGADIWADVGRSSEIFCSPGSYCPHTTRKLPCRSGHYCRMGSTSAKRCLKFTSCNPNTENQNIHAYGIVLIAALSTLLLIIYNCSDQVLTLRERRQAKSREAAARHARETAQARQRWISAKNVAKKRAGGLQEQLSRTFSRKKSARQSEQLKILGHAKPGTDGALLPPLPPGSSSTSKQSASASKAKKKEPSNLTKMLHSLEEDPDSHDGFNLEIGDKNMKKNMPKGKQMHTHSQIFKYAYGQLEKEKAMQQQNKDLTFSGVISMATGGEIRTRPVIEVAFKDLTLTLKGKNKHLLRCVSGKLMPGRVSAVMGPSGAGKTTFLSALAGKVTGCTMTGLILINGKVESMDSYKKIIGFVPQDDIVHGNLTVEENLRFSARCRLSADMPRPDKVLVVERVIECLGLQAVRDSLVGTVEKRGISGGQRKRVNVGLEMVMEPSLLILDEPTTGLDSSSSQLLLRALRREALEGVNICMVVHQPSYALFKMFDDLILLAKGGLTAYHGSAKKVEEYFVGLGITVPERVNPPDHFINILEGIVKPSSSVTREQLPVRWMLHNGYTIPPDMMQYAEGLATPSTGSNPSDGATEQSFAGDLWQDVMSNVELKRDHIQHNFLKSKDLSNRRTPGVAWQYRYFIGRVGKQRLREGRLQAADYLILLLAGVSLGTLAKVGDETFGSLGYTYTVIAVSLLCKISALRTFSLDKLHYWRESASGMSSLAHFLSKDAVDLFNIVIKPLVYLSMFYFFGNPRSSFADNYIVLLCLVYCVTGIAYVLAIYLEPSPAQLLSVLLPVVLTLIASQDKESGPVKYLGNLCYTKWALEAFIIANAERYSGVWLITRCNSLMQSGYDLHDWSLCLFLLIFTGVVSRVLAFFCMVTFQKK
ncbi:putative white-brown complex homolog protein 30 isoform X2 [Alnus glutinosa]|uniref:putative white-brown complex homolog protein 30 isoform X2 n=1 Tax=Alnus glutinosa TaxID=3517 RepID=UPI002D780313|nr:putative white-brown complex homolog protein 30 isoform X2 [Alnus glutinosa]